MSGIGLLILPGIVVLTFVTTYFAAKRRWGEADEIRGERTYEIDEHGVRVAGTTFSGYLEWKHFHTVDFDCGFVFMKTAQNQFHYFPESLVPDTTELRELVEQRLPAKAPKSSIFGGSTVVIIWLSIIAVVLALFFIPAGHK